MATDEQIQRAEHGPVGDKHRPELGEELDPAAVGGRRDDLPKGYYRSANFLGTFAAVCMGIICSYLGWVLPANTLSLINDDIGLYHHLCWSCSSVLD